jgi:hypothetical protein
MHRVVQPCGVAGSCLTHHHMGHHAGEAALANELLPSTKGHGMGWGWTVFTFGFAFLAPLYIFGKVCGQEQIRAI